MEQADEYGRRVLKTLVYIEDHLDEELTLDRLAKVASYSPYHFSRIFRVVVGEGLRHYLTRLRLEKGAGRLRHTDLTVMDVALDVGFETPSAFAKAFRAFTGMNPKNYRALYGALNIATQSIKEMKMIQPEAIIHTKDLPVLFVRKQGPYATAAPQAWSELLQFISNNNLDQSKIRNIGIGQDDPAVTAPEHLRYDAAISCPTSPTDGSIGKQTIKGGKYGVFNHYGPYKNLDETYDAIFLKWLPASSENFDSNRNCFQEYFHVDQMHTNPEKLVTKIHVPLK